MTVNKLFVLDKLDFKCLISYKTGCKKTLKEEQYQKCRYKFTMYMIPQTLDSKKA